MILTCQKQKIERNLLSLMKRIKEKLTANILPKGDRLMLSSEDQKTR
jgi:hypothetical protein